MTATRADPSGPFGAFGGGDVRALAERLRAALRSGAVGRMQVPPRVSVLDPAGRRYVSMPAVSPDHDLYINKVATIVTGAGGSTVTAVVPTFAATDGRFLGLLDGTAVTNLKCAAVTALVADRCAVAGPVVLGVIGSGVQARQQVLAVSAVRELAQVRVYARDRDRAAAFARDVTGLLGAAVTVRVCATAEQASAGVDVLSTATTSATPLPISTELPEHVHVTAMGAHTTETRELPAELLGRGVLLVEDRATALAEAGPSHGGAHELDALDSPAAADWARATTVLASVGCAWLDLVTCAHLLATGRGGRSGGTAGGDHDGPHPLPEDRSP